ncbi:circularly permutated Ras protein 1-like [Physella acuta]|uniref:circularly permutated Ras protein 1-like n=1 Tax=Physella acuta TaxID=109671 RepID=UPI0027DE2BE1|nr:circularly permutated Ras protein 1-like [Physella acuta]XP_059169854.1 circularly permutated Ras protein 1-like [Physella acuta]
MDFASKYILDNDEEEYESVSEEEFVQGMHISDSGSDNEEELLCAGDNELSMSRHPPPLGFNPKKKRLHKLQHHWRRKSGSKEGKHQSKTDSSSGSKDETQPMKTEDSRKQGSSSSSKMPGKRRFRRADTNVVSVNFSALLAPGNMHAGEPVLCGKCSAILSHISKVNPQTKEWQCEFCDEVMVIDVELEEIPTAEDVTYLMEPAMTTTASTMSGLDQSLVIFCVDTSGSMCVTSEISGTIKLRGTSQLRRLESFVELDEVDQRLPSQRGQSVTYISRLQAMQAAVDHQLGEMAKNHPNRRVALITFNNEVKIVGDGSQSEIIVAGDKLKNEEQLKQIGLEAALPQAIKGSRIRLGEKVYNLEEGGATALGPALLVAVNMASHHPGSKVILCTDGKANIGLGKLEDVSDDQASLDFYSKAAESAHTAGVTVSVITIEGTDCKLVHLGMLADKTGGQVNIVDPLKLTEEFGNILADPIIATKVKALCILHKELYVIDENDPDNQQSRVEHNAGNVKSSTTITFEFAKRKNSKCSKLSPAKSQETQGTQEKPTEGLQASGGEGEGHRPLKDFPFQLQINYVDTEGNKALRVLTRTKPATNDRKVTEDNVNLEILGAHVAKKSADLALKGQFSKSRGLALMNQRLAWRNIHSDTSSTTDRVKYKTIFSKIQSMENFVQQKQMREIDLFGRTRSDSEHSENEDGDDEASSDAVMCDSYIPPPVKRHTKGYIASKFRKMHSERASEMDDNMANMMYKFRSVGASEMSSTGNEGKFLAIGSSSSGEKNKKTEEKK